MIHFEKKYMNNDSNQEYGIQKVYYQVDQVLCINFSKVSVDIHDK